MRLRRTPRRLACESLEDRTTPAPANTVPTFGTDGLVTLPVPEGTRFTGVTTDPGTGDVILAGGSAAPAGGDGRAKLYVLRLSADGELVDGFGNGGVYTRSFRVPLSERGGSVVPFDLVAGPAGITVAFSVSGFSTPGAGADAKLDVLFARLTADGDLDRSYSGDGLVTVASVQNGATFGPTALTPPTDLSRTGRGAVVTANPVAGPGLSGPFPFTYEFEYTVTRVDADGNLATTVVEPPSIERTVNNSDERLLPTNSISGVAVADDGAVTFGANSSLLGNGSSTQPSLFRSQVVRVTAGGELDPAFGTGGGKVLAATGGPFGPAQATVVGVQSGGRTVVLAPQTFARLTPAGAIDRTFGDDGLADGFATDVLPNGQLRNVRENRLLTANGLPIDGPAGVLIADRDLTVEDATTAVLDSTAGPDRFAVFTTPPNELLERPGKIQFARAVGPTLPLPNDPPTIGPVGDVTGTAGTAFDPIPLTLADDRTPVADLRLSVTSSNTDLFPNSLENLFVGLTTGGGRRLFLTPADGQTGTSTITLTVTDGGGRTATETFTVTVEEPTSPPPVSPPPVSPPPVSPPPVGPPPVSPPPVSPPPVSPPPVSPPPVSPPPVSPPPPTGRRAVAPPAVAPGAAVSVSVTTAAGTPLVLTPFEPTFTGGASVVVLDIGGGNQAVVVGAGDGGAPRVVVFDADTGEPLASFFAFESSFRNGVAVATGPNGTLAVGANAGGGPRVRTFNPDGTPAGLDFFAFDSALRGGVTVAAADFNADGTVDLAAGAGLGGEARVRVFDGGTGAELGNFPVGPAGDRGGVRVSAADLDSDGTAELVARAAGVPGVYDPLTGADATADFPAAAVNAVFVG